MYKELAEEKAEKEAREKERQPKERDFDKEQADRIAEVRKTEESGRIRQCNEGKWEFSFDEHVRGGGVGGGGGGGLNPPQATAQRRTAPDRNEPVLLRPDAIAILPPSSSAQPQPTVAARPTNLPHSSPRYDPATWCWTWACSATWTRA